VVFEIQLILSIGKLSELARGQNDEERLDDFDKGLNFVSVQKDLLDQFTSVLEKLRGRQSLESQIDAILKAKATKLDDRPSLGMVCLIRWLIREIPTNAMRLSAVQEDGERHVTRQGAVCGRYSGYLDYEGQRRVS
jgi:hypothetical protein